MIDGNVVGDLCRLGVLGNSESSEAEALLERLRPRGELSRRHRKEWNRLTDALDTASLARLVRGLLLIEEALSQWSSGSVSPVIWTFLALERRSPEAAREVAEWGRDKTTNAYVPFSKGNAPYWVAKRERSHMHQERQKQQQADAEQRKHERSEHRSKAKNP